MAGVISKGMFLALAIASIILGSAAMLVSFEAYSLAKSTQIAPSVTATLRSIGERFRWNLGEVVDVQGNLYEYLGFVSTNLGSLGHYSLRFCKVAECLDGIDIPHDY